MPDDELPGTPIKVMNADKAPRYDELPGRPATSDEISKFSSRRTTPPTKPGPLGGQKAPATPPPTNATMRALKPSDKPGMDFMRQRIEGVKRDYLRPTDVNVMLGRTNIPYQTMMALAKDPRDKKALARLRLMHVVTQQAILESAEEERKHTVSTFDPNDPLHRTNDPRTVREAVGNEIANLMDPRSLATLMATGGVAAFAPALLASRGAKIGGGLLAAQQAVQRGQQVRGDIRAGKPGVAAVHGLAGAAEVGIAAGGPHLAGRAIRRSSGVGTPKGPPTDRPTPVSPTVEQAKPLSIEGKKVPNAGKQEVQAGQELGAEAQAVRARGAGGVADARGSGQGAGGKGKEAAGKGQAETDRPTPTSKTTGIAEKVTGPRNKITESERAARGVSPIEKYRRTSPQEGFEAGKQVPEADAMALAQRVAETPRQLEPHETGALSSQRVRLNQSEDVIEKEILAARKAGSKEAESHAQEKLDVINSQRDIVDHALTFAGTEQSGAFYARTMLTNEIDNSFVKARQSFEVNHGRPPSGNPADPLSEVSNLRKAVEDHQAATKDLQAHSEGQEAEQTRLRERISELEITRAEKQIRRDAGRQTRAIDRSARKADLDSRIADIAGRYKKKSGRLQAGFDPTGGRFDEATTAEVAKWAGEYARLLVERNIKISMQEIVSETWIKLKEHFEDISSRETRDLISLYGKVSSPNPEVVAARFRETRAQMRLTSALEDAKAKVRPLKSGPQRDAASTEVRGLTKQVRAAIKEADFPTTKENIAAKMKSALDAVKTRLKNEIEDYDKLIASGEKKPKKLGLKYDTEAINLKAQRDAKVAEYNKLHEGDLNQSKIAAAVKSTQKSISDVAERIAKGDTAPRGPKSSPWSPELGKLKLQQQALYKQLAELRKASSGKDPLAAYKQHLADRLNELEAETRQGFKNPPKPRNARVLDEEAIRLKAAVDNARIIRDRAIRANTKSVLDKFLDYARAAKLSGYTVIEKLLGASFWHHPTEIGSEPFGYAAGKLRVGGKSLASVAEREGYMPGRGYMTAARNALKGKGLKAAVNEIRGIASDITVLSGGAHDDGTLTGLPGRLHGAEKMIGIGQIESDRSIVIRTERAVAQGKSLDNPEMAIDIATKSAIDAQTAMLRNENQFSRKLTQAAEVWTRGKPEDRKMGYAILGSLFKSMVPFGRFGANFLGKSIRMTGYGVLEGGYKIGQVSRGKVELTPAVADDIIRAFKYGGLGAIAAYLGTHQPKGFKSAGYYAPNGVSPVTGSDGKPMKPGEIELFGHRLPPILSHAPFWNAVSAWSTFANGLQHGERKKSGSIWQAAYQTTRGIAMEVPGTEDIASAAKGEQGQAQAKKALGGYARGMVIPGAIQQASRHFGVLPGVLYNEPKKPKKKVWHLKMGSPKW